MNGSIVRVYFDEDYNEALKSGNPFSSEIEEIEQKSFCTKDGEEVYRAVSRMTVELSHWIETYATLAKYTHTHFGDGAVVLVYDSDILGIPMAPMVMFICDNGEVRVTEISEGKENI